MKWCIQEEEYTGGGGALYLWSREVSVLPFASDVRPEVVRLQTLR